MTQVAVIGELTSCEDSKVISTQQGFIYINGMLVATKGSLISVHAMGFHAGQQIANCQQNFVFINGIPIAKIGSLTDCPGALKTNDKGQAQQNFIFIS